MKKAKKPRLELPDIGYYVFGARTETAAEFRILNTASVEETLSELNRLYSIILVHAISGRDLLESAKLDSYKFFVDALESLVSALHLTLHRQAREAMALMRLSLESAATAAHICKCQRALADYNALKYKSTYAISYAKNIVPIIGEIWGGISKLAVHVNRLHGPCSNLSENGEAIVSTINISIGKKKALPGQDEILLTFICLISNINLRLFELTLLEESTVFVGGLQLPGTTLLYTCPTDGLIAKYHDQCVKFTERLKDNR